MDTKLGTITLTENQISGLVGLKTDNIKGFCYWRGRREIVVVSNNELTQQEKDELIAAIQALPYDETEEKKERRAKKKAVMQKLGLSKQQLKALIWLIQDGDDDS